MKKRGTFRPKTSAAERGASARRRSVRSARMSAGSSGHALRNDRAAETPLSIVKRARPARGLVRRSVAPRTARLRAQRTLRIEATQPGPPVARSMEPPRVALPAIARTRDREIPSLLPTASGGEGEPRVATASETHPPLTRVRRHLRALALDGPADGPVLRQRPGELDVEGGALRRRRTGGPPAEGYHAGQEDQDPAKPQHYGPQISTGGLPKGSFESSASFNTVDEPCAGSAHVWRRD